MLIYTMADPLSNRRAIVENTFPAGGDCPFRTQFVEDGRIDHFRRYSRAAMATAAADEWCNYAGQHRHFRRPRAARA